LKFGLIVLVPVTVAFAAFSEPILTAIYGSKFASAGLDLAILAPVVLLLTVVAQTSALIASRGAAAQLARLTAAAAALNIVLNFVLIPIFNDRGAAAAMVITEVAFAVLALAMADRAVGGVAWPTVVASPAVGAIAMTAVIIPLHEHPLAALLVAAPVYLLAVVALERRIAPNDVRALVRIARGFLRRNGEATTAPMRDHDISRTSP
jgi:O-antigen/teichoic acid export membrane protein